MSGLILRRMTAADAPLIEEYRASFPKERMRVTFAPDRIPGLNGLEKFESAAGWLERLRGMRGKVSAFLSVRPEDGRMTGALMLRHRLEYDDDDPEFASHIGYSIRPDERRRGYAKEQLRLGLEQARSIGLERVRLICSDSNTGSIRTILANGGVYVDSILGEESGLRVNRYDIILK